MVAEERFRSKHQIAEDSCEAELVGVVGVGGPSTRLTCRVGRPQPKNAKNRMHLDLTATDPEADVARLVEPGRHSGC